MKQIRSILFLYLHVFTFYIVEGQIEWQFDGTPANILLGGGLHSLSGCDVNGDSYADLIAGSTGYVFVFHGSSTGFDSSPNRTLSGVGSFGIAVTCGHFNDDTYDDVIVGDSGNNIVRAFLGGSGGVNTTSSFQVSGPGTTNYGISLTSCDMNGDGYSDIAVGAPLYTNSEANEGAVYIYYSSSSGTGLQSSGSLSMESNDPGAQFGSILACGPIDGDSYSDLIVGSPSASSAAGRVEVFQGSASGLQTTAFWTKNGNFTGNSFGSSISARGDINQDGFPDMAIASYQLVEIYFGNSSLKSEPDSYYSFPTTDTVTCAIVPDTNKDTFDDVLIGEPHFGRVRLFRGGNLPLSNTNVYLYSSVGVQAGNTLYGIGDIDGDTVGDIVLSEPGYSTNTGRITVVRQLAPSASPTPSVTPSRTPSPSTTPSVSPTASVTASVTPTVSATPSVTPSGSPSPSPSRTPSTSRTPSRSPSRTPSPSASPGNCNPPTIFNCGTFCTNDPAQCVPAPSVCSDDTPFECEDGSCADSASGCDETDCGTLVLCWDGSCAGNLQDCPPVTSCPSSYPLRCWNGCFNTSTTCNPIPCMNGYQVACIDGSCQTTNSQCSTYNGCPLGYIECASGLCVASSADCACQESGQTGAYQCFEVGCSDSCKLPPWRVKPVMYTVTVKSASTTTIPISDTYGNSIGEITIEANSFSTDVFVSITSVPDSVILGGQGVVAYIAPAISLEVQSGDEFSTPIGLCFEYTLPDGTVTNPVCKLTCQTEKDLSNACLMTILSGNWNCQGDVTVDGTSICGSLTHFSEWSFGILEKSQDSSNDDLPLWAFIVIIAGGAAVLGAIVTLIIVAIRKKQKRKEEYEMY